MNPKKFPMPTGMLLKTDDEEKFLPFQNPTTYKDIIVELKPNGEALRVYVTATQRPCSASRSISRTRCLKKRRF